MVFKGAIVEVELTQRARTRIDGQVAVFHPPTKRHHRMCLIVEFMLGEILWSESYPLLQAVLDRLRRLPLWDLIGFDGVELSFPGFDAHGCCPPVS